MWYGASFHQACQESTHELATLQALNRCHAKSAATNPLTSLASPLQEAGLLHPPRHDADVGEENRVAELGGHLRPKPFRSPWTVQAVGPLSHGPKSDLLVGQLRWPSPHRGRPRIELGQEERARG